MRLLVSNVLNSVALITDLSFHICVTPRYRRLMKRNNSTVQLHSGQIVQVQYFVTVEVSNSTSTIHLAVVKAYDQLGPCHLSLLSGSNADTTTALGNLLHPVKLNDQLTAVPLSEIEGKCVVVSLRNSANITYVYTLPNAIEKD